MNKSEEWYKELINYENIENKGCLILDMSCYFPYTNNEVLDFDFTIDNKKITNYRVNDRYANKCYRTISKKYGRHLSLIGYPLVLPLEYFSKNITLKITQGVYVRKINLSFPIKCEFTEERPFGYLSFAVKLLELSDGVIKEPDFTFLTISKKQYGYSIYRYFNSQREDIENHGEKDTYMIPAFTEEKNLYEYNDIITINGHTKEELIIG